MHPIIAPADVISEFVLIVMSELPDMLLDAERIMLPATVSLAFTIKLPV
jgi:hypothetical protein